MNSNFSPLHYNILYQTAFFASICDAMFHVAAVSGCLSARCNCDLNAVCRFLLLAVQNTVLAFLSTQNSNRTLSVKWKRNCWKRKCRRNDTVKLIGCFECRVATSDHFFDLASLCFSVKFTYSSEMKGRLNPVNNGQNLVQNPAFHYAI